MASKVVTIQGVDTSDPVMLEHVMHDLQERVQGILERGVAEVSLMARGHWHAKLLVSAKDAADGGVIYREPRCTLATCVLGTYTSVALTKHAGGADHSRHFITVRDTY